MPSLPPPLTPARKRWLAGISIAVALTRLLAIARSPFDWDEALFALAVRDYDVAHHHPHPPGYPLFVLAAKGLHLLGADEFRSVQGVVVLGALLIFPAMFFLARETGFGFATATAGALLFAFLPNVWVYGGTGFSDVPAAALTFAACALLLRGRFESKAYVAGAALLGVAAGFRTPSLVIGAAPAVLATWCRLRAGSRRAVLLATVCGGAIAGGSYLGAALSSESIEAYRNILRRQSEYLRIVDSWQSPTRPPLEEVARVFFLWPTATRAMMLTLVALALIGVAIVLRRRQWHLLLPLAMFLPLAFVAWLYLDVETASRYAIGYLAAYAIFAAVAIEALTGSGVRLFAAVALCVAVLSVWIWPGLQSQRTTNAPPWAALSWVRANTPSGAVVMVHAGITPLADLMLPDRQRVYFEEEDDAAPPATTDAWLVDLHAAKDGRNFVRPRSSLFSVVRPRNFEASVRRTSQRIRFGDGWYAAEGDGATMFRWMGAESVAWLPPPVGPRGELTARIFTPLDTMQGPPPTVEVLVDGVRIDLFTSDQLWIDRTWRVAADPDRPSELRIRTSATVRPGPGDSRQLGLRFDRLGWTKAR